MLNLAGRAWISQGTSSASWRLCVTAAYRWQSSSGNEYIYISTTTRVSNCPSTVRGYISRSVQNTLLYRKTVASASVLGCIHMLRAYGKSGAVCEYSIAGMI